VDEEIIQIAQRYLETGHHFEYRVCAVKCNPNPDSIETPIDFQDVMDEQEKGTKDYQQRLDYVRALEKRYGLRLLAEDYDKRPR
jgi:hypothetical protein